MNCVVHLLRVVSYFCTFEMITNAAGIGSDRLGSFKHLEKPDGYLLGLKVVQYDQDRPQVVYYNHVSLFMISFDGNVIQLWNHSLGQHHTVYDQNNFAVDAKNELVYLGSVSCTGFVHGRSQDTISSSTSKLTVFLEL